MLDKVALADPKRLAVVEKLADDIKLVIAREDLLARLLAGLRVLLHHDLCVVFQDVRQAGWRKDALPQVVGLETLGIRRIAGAVLVALVKRQEPRGLALQLSAEAHYLVIHREVHHAAAELKQQLTRVAVALVLLNRVLSGLLGQAVL